MAKTEKIIVKVNEDLHPKTKRFPFVDKSGTKHESVAAAFLKVTEGRISRITVSQIIDTLTRIIYTQISTYPDKLGGLIRSTIGMNFILGQKTVDFLPSMGCSQGWNELYGVALSKARKMFLNVTKATSLEESTGAVPGGTQPCLKCGGSGEIAGTGYYLNVADDKYPGGWKYVGACFDCLPKGDTSGRGRGWIDRSQARKNHTYFLRHEIQWTESHGGIDGLNLWDPDDSNLWKMPERPVNMKEVILDVHDSEVPT